MSYLDKRISRMGDDLIYKDAQEAMYFEAEKWIKDFQYQQSGATFKFTEKTAEEFKNIPVETLIRDPYFLGYGDKVYDGVLEDCIQLFEERKKRRINLAVFLEGIGSGKTNKMSIIQWLLWFYDLAMHPDPQAYYDRAPRSVIALMNLSRSETQARKVTFTEVWERFQSPFNKDYFPPSPKFNREIRIDVNNTCIFAGTSSALSALGYNLYGGVIDEASFLEVVEDSKREQGDVFDAAEMMYYAIFNRMLSRFGKYGDLPGLLCMGSSPRYPDDFIHRKIDEAIKLGNESGIFWRRRSLWEAKGPKHYNAKDNFYIDTDNTEIIPIDGTTTRFLNRVSPKLFPLNLDIEELNKITQYLREVA